jgi:hypothetical protein
MHAVAAGAVTTMARAEALHVESMTRHCFGCCAPDYA